MNRKPIKRWQAKRIKDALYPGINYLVRLKERMVKVGFDLDDSLYILVRDAYDAMLRLTCELHYLRCASGMGRRTAGAAMTRK